MRLTRSLIFILAVASAIGAAVIARKSVSQPSQQIVRIAPATVELLVASRKIPAGKPIEAIEDVTVVEVPPAMIGNGDHFVLRVKGNSMEDEGILDGDFVVIRKQSTAENGETVVALINNEATVKKYYRKKKRVELRPAHQGMESFWFSEGDLSIEGKVVGVLRYYR